MVSNTTVAAPRAAGAATTKLWQTLRGSALVRLLGYVPRQRKFAMLTLCFGVLGFLLSFVYPSLIGAAVDLVAQPGRGRVLHRAQDQRLFVATRANSSAFTTLAGLALDTCFGN